MSCTLFLLFLSTRCNHDFVYIISVSFKLLILFIHQSTKEVLTDFSLGVVSRVFCSLSGIALLLTVLINLVVK